MNATAANMTGYLKTILQDVPNGLGGVNNMESIDEFLKRYGQRRWLYALTAPLLVPLMFVLLFVMFALVGAWLFVISCWYENKESIMLYPLRYWAILRGRRQDGQA